LRLGVFEALRESAQGCEELARSLALDGEALEMTDRQANAIANAITEVARHRARAGVFQIVINEAGSGHAAKRRSGSPTSCCQPSKAA
jgi:hypothetical protein